MQHDTQLQLVDNMIKVPEETSIQPLLLLQCTHRHRRNHMESPPPQVAEIITNALKPPDLMNMFLLSQDMYLALIILETLARRIQYNNDTDLPPSTTTPKPPLDALFYIFLTTLYPATSKELSKLFCHLLPFSVFAGSHLWRWCAEVTTTRSPNVCSAANPPMTNPTTTPPPPTMAPDPNYGLSLDNNYKSLLDCGSGNSIWYSVIALFESLPRDAWLGVLTQMSDGLGERVVLLTHKNALSEADDVKVMHYRGISDENLSHAIAVLLLISAKKLLLTVDTTESLFKDQCQVLLQVILDSLCSYLDLSALYPVATPAALILVVVQLVLDVILQKLSDFNLDSFCYHSLDKKKQKKVGEVLGVCNHVVVKVKAVVLVNNAFLATHARFSQVLAMCENFLKHLTDLSKMWSCSINSSNTFLFSSATMNALQNHFELLIAGAAKINPDYDVERVTDTTQEEDKEFLHEMNRLRKG
eukprot:Phypoly_transcript_00549.p2 GENE.Phypoly_transcript_00549~~Phypoly_transcript_00549.p2  ORF type:complete len:472 (+),score=57.34 Phypoly_transcript_00549:2808-4223(+)